MSTLPSIRSAMLAAALFAASFTAGLVATPPALGDVVVQYTNNSENDVSAADDKIVQDAFNFVYDHSDAVFDHLDAYEAAGDPFGYTNITIKNRGQWKDEVQRMADGKIKIDCNYNTASNKCGKDKNNPGLLGWTNTVDFSTGVFDQVNICMDNVKSQAADPTTCTAQPPASARAILAGVISHELMHHVDGFENHGPDGKTNPCSLDSEAETIGLAMEHLALIPDFEVKVKNVEVDWSSLHVTLDAEVTNVNEFADAGLWSTSGQILCGNTFLQLKVDGKKVGGQVATDALSGLESQTVPFEFDLAPMDVDNPFYNIEVIADPDDLVIEIDEANNTGKHNLGTKVDLSLDVEISGEPVEHVWEHHPNLDPFELSSWYTVTYAATVRNLDSSTPALPFNVQVKYREPFTDSGALAISDQLVPGLDPGASSGPLLFTVEVPAAASFTGGHQGLAGPSGSFSVTFSADPEKDSVNDSDWDNNTVLFVVNDDYWKADYVLTEGTTFSTAGTDGITLRYHVRNMGPVAGDEVIVSVSPDGATDPSFDKTVPALGVGEEVSYATAVSSPQCEVHNFIVKVDPDGALDESDEDNNSIKFTFGVNCDDPLIDDVIHGIDNLAHTTDWGTVNLGRDTLSDLAGSGGTVEWMEARISQGSSGTIGLPADFRTRYRHTLNLSHDYWAVISQPESTDVTPLRSKTLPPPAPKFRRGDPNGDGRGDLSDAIGTLAWLFTGGEAPACEDAADFNDDGRADLSDAVAELSFLFLGAGGPAPPAGSCGVDPTVDQLPCEPSCQ